LLPLAARLRLSRAVPLLEAFVAGGLLLDATRTAAGCVGIVLLLVYAGAISVNLLRGRRELACAAAARMTAVRSLHGWSGAIFSSR